MEEPTLPITPNLFRNTTDRRRSRPESTRSNLNSSTTGWALQLFRWLPGQSLGREALRQPFNTVGPAGYRFWELLDQVVQEEPSDSLDEVTLGFFQSIGIQRQTLHSRRADEEDPHRSGCPGGCDRPCHRLSYPKPGGVLLRQQLLAAPVHSAATSSRRCRACSISMARLSITSWRPA
jgi:hypothetical protein